MKQSTKTKFSILKELIGKNWKYASAFIGSIAWIATCLFFCINVTWWLLVVAVSPYLIYTSFSYLNAIYEDRQQALIDNIEKEISELEWLFYARPDDFHGDIIDRLTKYLDDYAQYYGKDEYYERTLFHFERLLNNVIEVF